ncbi:M23 family metallopeptidase [bacterium]|nr:M23 family metallopeptidase [bacterium]
MRRAAMLAILGLVLTTCIVASACGEKNANADVAVQFASASPAASASAPAPIKDQTSIPPPQLVLSTLTVPQGGAILVSVVGSVTGGSIGFLGRTYQLAQGAKSMYSFVGVAPEDPVGPAKVAVQFTMTNGTKGTLVDDVTVEKTQWTVDSLEFNGETEQLADPKVLAADQDKLQGIYRRATPKKLWDGPWQMPVDGKITAKFGEQRSVDGGPVSGHHPGSDIGVAVGTDVRAPNSGTVSFTGQLQAYGNVIVIDHGGGLYSTFGHLSEIGVHEGQAVKTGDIIGKSGNTGLSTGPHLHWEMAIDGVLIDATKLVDGTDGV